LANGRAGQETVVTDEASDSPVNDTKAKQKKARPAGVGGVPGPMLPPLANLTGLSEIIKGLQVTLPTIRVPDLSAAYKIPPIAPRPEIGLLAEVHAELEGMAKLLGESGRQAVDMVEVTRANLAATQANLTALNAVIGELQISKKAADTWNTRVFWLTVAIFAATAVAAIAVVPEFVRQIAAAVTWVQSLH
jgi:hypothetical protein